MNNTAKVLRQLKQAGKNKGNALVKSAVYMVNYLKDYEIDTKKYFGQNQEDFVDEMDTREDTKFNNSYNWNSDIVFEIHTFKSPFYFNGELVAIKYHLSGDVRCNYSDWVVYSGRYEGEILEAISEIGGILKFNIGKFEVCMSNNVLDEANTYMLDIVAKDEDDMPLFELNEDCKYIDVDTFVTTKRELIKNCKEALKKIYRFDNKNIAVIPV